MVILFQSNNHLEIQFHSPIEVAKQYAAENNFTPPECPANRYNGECHMNQLRKMQASFAWDWGLAAPSVGIWYLFTNICIKSIELIQTQKQICFSK